jgi:hypothetical protein
MGVLLFALSVIVFLLGVGASRDGYATEAYVAYLSATILSSAAAIVATIRAELARRCPRTGDEKMAAYYEEHKREIDKAEKERKK